MVRRNLAATREQARAAIEAGDVTVQGAPAAKPSRLVATGEIIVVRGRRRRFVSRGGDKLDAALDQFALPVDGRRAIDVGASTGGFTDCLLQRGAARVVAIDVGYGQLHERLRADQRVDVCERTNIRSVTPDAIGGPASIVVADLSFISLRTVAGVLVALVERDGDLITLVKPQFEAGRVEAARGRGVVRDPVVWRRVLSEVVSALEQAGAAIMGGMVSPLTGAQGNVEFLLHARPRTTSEAPGLDLDALVDGIVPGA